MKIQAGLIAAIMSIAVVPQAPSQESCDPDKACCVKSCSGSTAYPTTEQCVADACACAQQLHCYAVEREKTWALFPGSKEFEPTTRPVHGRYITILANPTAIKGLETFAPGKPGPVDMPAGSVVIKSNFIPDATTPGKPDPSIDKAAITTMFKLDKYCPQTSGATSTCVGGDWYYLLRLGDVFPVFGKPGGCVNCHSAAEAGDWMWRLFAARRFHGPDTSWGGN